MAKKEINSKESYDCCAAEKNSFIVKGNFRTRFCHFADSRLLLMLGGRKMNQFWSFAVSNGFYCLTFFSTYYIRTRWSLMASFPNTTSRKPKSLFHFFTNINYKKWVEIKKISVLFGIWLQQKTENSLVYRYTQVELRLQCCHNLKKWSLTLGQYWICCRH